MVDIHVGRQPIFDRGRDVVGYELLFRPGIVPQDTGHEAATATVIVNTFTEFGVDGVAGDVAPWINVTQPFLTGETPLPFAPGDAVLEILEHVEITDALVENVRRLTRWGHRFALDDFVWTDAAVPMLELVETVKLDVLAIDPAELPALVARLRAYDVKLLAEKVETAEQLAMAEALGFDLYQGYHLSEPTVLSATGLDPGKLTCVRLVAMLSDPSSSIDDIEQLVRYDPALTFRVLRVTNSAAIGLRRKVASVRDAIVLLGRATLRAWLLVMSVADSGAGAMASLTDAMTRGRMCELLAPYAKGAKPDVAFTLGLISSLDRVLGVPLDELVAGLPLDSDIKHALFDGDGVLGKVLGTVVGYEAAAPSSEWPLAVDLAVVRGAYLEATRWAVRTTSSVRSALDESAA